MTIMYVFIVCAVIILFHCCLAFENYCSVGESCDHKDLEAPNSLSKTTMSLSLANSYVIKSSVPAQAVVIFLHGLGDNGQGWSAAFNDIKRQDTQYIFPNAGTQPVSLNGGFRMPAWYDLKTLDGSVEDEDGIISASKGLETLIDEVLKSTNVPSTKLFLGGFSQGGSLALHTGLMYKQQLGGIIALSSWLPLNNLFTESLKGHSLANQKCRLFQGHGNQDPVVNFKFGKMSFDLLKTSSLQNPVFKVYEGMGHSSSPQELKDIKLFIEECLVAS